MPGKKFAINDKVVVGTDPGVRPEYRGKIGHVRGYTLSTVVLVEFKDVNWMVQFTESDLTKIEE